MDEPRKRNVRWLLGVLVVAIAAGTLWAATALAGSGSSTPPAAKPTAKAPPAAKIQGKARPHSGRDCPNKAGNSIQSSLDV